VIPVTIGTPEGLRNIEDMQAGWTRSGSMVYFSAGEEEKQGNEEEAALLSFLLHPMPQHAGW